MNKQCIFLIMLFAMMISGKTYHCYAQEKVEPTIHLTISVIADSTGKPITGAKIHIEGSDGSVQTDSTNESGIACFFAVRRNVFYNICVSSPKYYTEKHKLFLTDAVGEQQLKFRMMRIPILGNSLPKLYFRKNLKRLKWKSKKELETMSAIMEENRHIIMTIWCSPDQEEESQTRQKMVEKVREMIVQHDIEISRIIIDTADVSKSDRPEFLIEQELQIKQRVRLFSKAKNGIQR